MHERNVVTTYDYMYQYFIQKMYDILCRISRYIDSNAQSILKLHKIMHFHSEMLCVSHSKPIVGNQRLILFDPLFHHPWVHLMTFACFQSNMHDLCDLFLPNEIMYACCSSFSGSTSKFCLDEI